ncbi:MAG: dTDP-glucose 4,6-dehydratase [Acidobacteriota bacterium]
MSTLLITGGAGFIGCHFVRMAANNTDDRLIILDDLTYAGDITRLRDLIDSKRITFIKGNICDSALLEKLFSDHCFDIVVNFAAESHVDRSILGPRAFITTNVEGTYTLLEAARKSWKSIDNKLFLQVSTDEVYGALGPDDPPFNENSQYKPNSPYSASKAASDHLARAWHKTYSLPAVITNCSNNYGIWQFPEKLIPLMILNALEGKELPIYGDGQQVRDWVHVEDHCSALLKIIQKGIPGEVYLIGANEEKANLDVVKQICGVVDSLIDNPPGTSARLMKTVADRPGHDRRYAIDNTKTCVKLGWTPRHSFETALPQIAAWYIENRLWADRVRSGEYQSFYEKQYGTR